MFTNTKVTKEFYLCIVGLTGFAIALLCYALFGRPSYPFYSLLKWTVAAAAGSGAWLLYTQNKRYIPLAFSLAVIGAIHLFARMRRSEWMFFNCGALACFTGLLIILFVELWRSN
jgi:hypothetical protein